jgi:hypothetical protein
MFFELETNKPSNQVLSNTKVGTKHSVSTNLNLLN